MSLYSDRFQSVVLAIVAITSGLLAVPDVARAQSSADARPSLASQYLLVGMNSPVLLPAYEPAILDSPFFTDEILKYDGYDRAFGPAGLTLTPPHTEGKKNFFLTIAEVTAVNIIVWSYSRFISPQDWAKVSWESWKKNLDRGWVYDDNRFADNQIFHPLHGNLYYNAARANGYSYWESMPFVFFGSWTWEYFGETHPAAPNDWLNTSLGGIALGEMTYRAASLIVDNTATGASRTWSEIAGGIINPVRGLNRVAKGETSRVYENDEDFHPDVLQTALEFGGRATGGDNVDDVFTAAYVKYQIDYGDEWEDDIESPFDVFDLDMQLNFRENNTLGSVRVAGVLLSEDVNYSGRRTSAIRMMQYFEYFNNQFLEHATQSFGAAYFTSWKYSGNKRLRLVAHARGILFGATSSEYGDLGGRTYDYGSGGSFKFQAFFDANYFEYVKIEYQADYLKTVNGAPGQHLVQVINVDVAVPVWRRMGVGASYSYLSRFSWFEQFPDVQQRNGQLKWFARYRFGS
jgi:Domain of unknown function (DUF3943)